jgi:TetR/AcrR family transcriptional regulator, mexJK operon transcriptional repressor
MSPDLIAINRIIISEGVRFPTLGEVFWQTGPEQVRRQIEAFLRCAVDAGTLNLIDARMAAEQFIFLVRGDLILRELLGLGGKVDDGAMGRGDGCSSDVSQSVRKPRRTRC